MIWTDQHTREIDAMFAALPEQRRLEIDVKAAMLFCNMQMLGLASERLPGSVPQLTPGDVARFRQLAILVEASTAFIQHGNAASKP